MTAGHRKEEVNTLKSLLDIKRSIVGIKFYYEEEAYNKCPAQQVIHKIPYCVMVKCAASGHDIKIRKENIGCGAAARVLGMGEVTESYLSGADSMGMGMYVDQNAAKKAVDKISINPKCPCGIELSPLEMMQEDPDIVIIVTDPYNVMRLIHGYSYHYGAFDRFKMAGNQAMCAEITACTYVTDNVNISMMCSGTRFLSKWGRDELAMGIPYGKFGNVLDGLCRTADPLERDADKKRIMAAFEEKGMKAPEFNMGRNYDTGYYYLGKSARR